MTDLSNTRTDATAIIPVPADAPPCPGLAESQLAAAYAYRDAEGRLLQYILRIDRADSERPGHQKSIWPYTYVRRADGTVSWERRALPCPRPLYGLDELARRPQSTVLLVEGEKCVDVARTAFPDAVVMTWPGGSNAVSEADFDPLLGRDVILMPDHDEPGRKAMRAVADALHAAGARSVLQIDTEAVARATLDDAPTGCDIADVLERGYELNSFAEFLETFPATEALPQPAKEDHVAPVDPAHAVLLKLYGCEVDLPPEFQLSVDGITKTAEDGRGRVQTIFVSSPLYVIGRTRTGPGGAGWGHLLAYRTPLGSWDTVVIPATMLAGDGREVRELLAHRGVTCGQGRAERQALLEYIGYAVPEEVVEVATRTGWHGTSFVLPDRVISAEGAPRVMAPDQQDVEHHFGTGGSFERWQAMAASLCRTSRGAFAISVALCAPLAELVGETGGGFHLFGQSSQGKTTLLVASGSVWGGGGRDGAVGSWSMTANGGEAIAALHFSTLLALDEIHLASREEIAEIVYRIANGRGKACARRDGGAATSAEWQAMILSSGEADIATRLAGDRRGASPMTGGLAVRMVDVPHAVLEDQAFEAIGDHPDERAFVQWVRSEAMTHYGHAGPAFAERLVTDLPGARAAARDLIAGFIAEAIDPRDDPQVERVAYRFGLAAAAGTLASRWGILPWPEETAHRAAQTCFRAWLSARGTTSSQEEINALRQVAAFFEAHGTSRFERVIRNGAPGEVCEDDAERSEPYTVIRDRCGYRGPGWNDLLCFVDRRRGSACAIAAAIRRSK